MRSVTTDEDGRFQLTDLSAGAYQILAKSPHWRSEPVVIGVGTAEARDSVVLAVEPALAVEGFVTVATVPCLEGIVEARGPSEMAAVVREGIAHLDGLLPGDYEFAVRCPGGVPQAERRQLGLAPTDVQWDLATGLSVTGSVEDYDGAPLSQIVVRVDSTTASNVSSQCLTTETGEFVCSGLVPGAYSCAVSNDLRREFQPVHVTLGESTPPVLLRAEASGTIRVSLLPAAAGATGRVQVLARRSGGPPVLGEPRAGEFVLERIPLGSYDVFIPPEADPGAASHARVVLERAGQIVSVQLARSPGKSISGRVVDVQQAPIADAWVQPSFMDPLLAAIAEPLPAVLSDEQGEFLLPDLPLGRYELAVDGATAQGRLESVEAGAKNVLIWARNQADARSAAADEPRAP